MMPGMSPNQMMGTPMPQEGNVFPFPFMVPNTDQTAAESVAVPERMEEQPDNQVAEVKPEEPKQEEVTTEAEDLKDESVVLTAMDMATGKKPSKKKGKTKAVALELPETKVNVPKKKK